MTDTEKNNIKNGDDCNCDSNKNKNSQKDSNCDSKDCSNQ